MTPAAVLSHLSAIGIRLEVQGEALHAIPRTALTDADRALIRAHKPALVDYLTELTAPPPLSDLDHEAITEAIEERAAIREFEGGEPRKVAERGARLAMRIFDALVAMPEGDPRPARWVTLLLPGCDLAQAQAVAGRRFPGRVLEVREHG